MDIWRYYVLFIPIDRGLKPTARNIEPLTRFQVNASRPPFISLRSLRSLRLKTLSNGKKKRETVANLASFSIPVE